MSRALPLRRHPSRRGPAQRRGAPAPHLPGHVQRVSRGRRRHVVGEVHVLCTLIRGHRGCQDAQQRRARGAVFPHAGPTPSTERAPRGQPAPEEPPSARRRPGAVRTRRPRPHRPPAPPGPTAPRSHLPAGVTPRGGALRPRQPPRSRSRRGPAASRGAGGRRPLPLL